MTEKPIYTITEALQNEKLLAEGISQVFLKHEGYARSFHCYVQKQKKYSEIS